MSFLLTTFPVPLWFLLFVLACAAPLWLKWYQAFYHRFIRTGILQRKLKKATRLAEEKLDSLKDAGDNWSLDVEEPPDDTVSRQEAAPVAKKEKSTERKKSSSKSVTSSKKESGFGSDQPYVKIVLKTLALQGDTGMMIQSIADKLEINSNEIKKALSYLEKNEFIEGVTGGGGVKYYLADRGRRYSIKRGYIKG